MRVVIAEDAALFREGLVRLLQDRGHQVCAAVADGDALLAAVAEHRPDVAVVDIRMPPTHTDEGLRAALELRRRRPGTGVLVFSQYIETRYATELLANAAKHSQATRIGLRATGRDGRLLLSVTDDGAGGADPEGSGLSGLAQRVSTVDGRLEIASPPGGPTGVTVELPLRA